WATCEQGVCLSRAAIVSQRTQYSSEHTRRSYCHITCAAQATARTRAGEVIALRSHRIATAIGSRIGRAARSVLVPGHNTALEVEQVDRVGVVVDAATAVVTVVVAIAGVVCHGAVVQRHRTAVVVVDATTEKTRRVAAHGAVIQSHRAVVVVEEAASKTRARRVAANRAVVQYQYPNDSIIPVENATAMACRVAANRAVV